MKTCKLKPQNLDLHDLEIYNSTTVPQNSQIQAGHGSHRNAFIFGFTPQAELWNGRLAMLGFAVFVIWEIGYSILRGVWLHL